MSISHPLFFLVYGNAFSCSLALELSRLQQPHDWLLPPRRPQKYNQQHSIALSASLLPPCELNLSPRRWNCPLLSSFIATSSTMYWLYRATNTLSPIFKINWIKLFSLRSCRTFKVVLRMIVLFLKLVYLEHKLYKIYKTLYLIKNYTLYNVMSLRLNSLNERFVQHTHK